MKVKCLIFLLLLIPSVCHSANQTAASCSLADIQTAVDACISSAGGTVTIPACSPNPYTWTPSTHLLVDTGTTVDIGFVGSGESTTEIVGFSIQLNWLI